MLMVFHNDDALYSVAGKYIYKPQKKIIAEIVWRIRNPICWHTKYCTIRSLNPLADSFSMRSMKFLYPCIKNCTRAMCNPLTLLIRNLREHLPLTRHIFRDDRFNLPFETPGQALPIPGFSFCSDPYVFLCFALPQFLAT